MSENCNSLRLGASKFFKRFFDKALAVFTVLSLLAPAAFNVPVAYAARPCTLKLTVTPSSTSISQGSQVTYNIVLKNLSAFACSESEIIHYLANNEKFVSSNKQPTISNSSINYWWIGRMAAGQTYRISLITQNTSTESGRMSNQMCASDTGANEVCVNKSITVTGISTQPPVTPPNPPVTPPATTTPVTPPTNPTVTPPPPTTPIASGALTQAWIYPGAPACGASAEYSDGRQIDTLKPEYYTLTNSGTLQQMTASSHGCNGYSAANAADIKTHSKNQYVTVSGSLTGMRALLSSASLQNSAVTTLTNFVVSNGFTGVELDWEQYGSWSATDYANFRSFTVALADSLHAKGKKLMIDGPALTSASSKFKYEDFTHLDYLTIMVYDYQYDYGVGQPVAPLSWISNVVNYAKTKLPVDKIVVGIPAYGYHGTLGSYTMTLDTYAQSKALPGYSTRKLNADGEETWTVGNTYYSAQPQSALNKKKALVESLGIKNVSVWHLGGNNWF